MIKEFFRSIDQHTKGFIILISIIFVANSVMNTVITIAVTTSTEVQLENKLNNQTVNELRTTVEFLVSMLNQTLYLNENNQRILLNGTSIGQQIHEDMYANRDILHRAANISHNNSETLQKIEDTLNKILAK